MNPMKGLYRFELKKLLQRRIYWIALAVMVTVLLTNELFPVFTGNYAEGLARDRTLSGTVLDDDFLDEIKASDNPRSFGPLYDFVLLSTQQQDFSDLDENTMYEKRLAEIGREMDANKITSGEKQYWLKKDAQVEMPYTFTYSGACMAFFESVYFLNFMVLIMAGITLAGVFADEKTLGTDQVLFCTRLGRKKLCRVKILAGMTVSTLSTLVLLASELIIAVALYGTDGFDAVLQIFLPSAMYDLTIGQANLIFAALLLAVNIFLSVLAMYLSQLTRSHSAVMALMIVVLFLSMITPPASLRVVTQLWNMMPGAFCGEWAFYDYHLLGFAGHYLNCLQAAPIVYLLVGGVLVYLTESSYERCEVKNK